jgi:hypothetical protein
MMARLNKLIGFVHTLVNVERRQKRLYANVQRFFVFEPSTPLSVARAKIKGDVRLFGWRRVRGERSKKSIE